MIMQAKRIVHITETMASGVLKYLQEVVSATDDGSIQHIIFYSKKRAYTPQKLSEQFPSYVHLKDVDIDLRHFSRSLNELYRCIRHSKPEIVHLHSSIAGLFGRILSIAFPRIRFYYTPHGYSFLMSNRSAVARKIYWLCEFVLSQTHSTVIACSKSECKHAKQLSRFRSAHLVENALKPGETVADIFRSPFQVIGVGRMEEQKDPKYFIRIVAELRKKHPDLSAVWIGDGSLMQECVMLNKELKANVRFTGWLSNKETLEHLKASNCYLQTSKWEGLPFSVLEAMTFGLPVVASDLEFHQDLFEQNYMGFLAGDVEHFVDMVDRLINDTDLASNISSFNRMRLAQNYQMFTQKLFSIYYQ